MITVPVLLISGSAISAFMVAVGFAIGCWYHRMYQRKECKIRLKNAEEKLRLTYIPELSEGDGQAIRALSEHHLNYFKARQEEYYLRGAISILSEFI